LYEFFTLIALIIFYSSLLIQLLFFTAIFSRLIWFKAKNQKTVQKKVSVIIAAHNEYDNLKVLIPTILRQKYSPGFEIIVVLDRCADNSAEFLKELIQSHSYLKVIEIQEKVSGFDPKKYALTKGTEAAANEIILLTDADCLPLTDFWIESMAACYQENTDVVLGYSPYQSLPGLLNSLIRFETFYTCVQYMSFSMAGFPYMAVGRNYSYSKEYFKKVNGYEGIENLTGGDDDLLIQKGLAFVKVEINKSQT
jgi:cellulose synthase/poly-beta-1,6-N-acetylglucosamine synthase-like glycosyltransferase